MSLTSRQRTKLRSMANTIVPVFQIGKGGLNDTIIQEILANIEARELIKIKVLKNAEGTAKEIAGEIAEKTDIEVVQVIGSIITLYKRSEKKPKIDLDA